MRRRVQIGYVETLGPPGVSERIQFHMCCNSALGSRSAPFPTKQTWPPTLTASFDVPRTTA